MLKIGITGNIGSGKTTVSKIFEILGIPVFYADDAAKRVMVADQQLITEIKAAFGNESYFSDGTLNRKHIAAIVFNNDKQLARLNAIVHPATFRAFDAWVKTISNVPYVLKEAALLFESASFKMCDYNIMVQAPFESRVERVIKRDGLTREEIKKRESYQFSEEEKSGLADFVIKNDGSELVIPQVLALHEKICSLVH
ncbi:dephospho-CoA kinase [Mucilaginibacter gotjawali]|uniref:Dephospho-CoA kinase n=2 Tax=Mucilaginibacter gotjawali TaxID=1550579 RepID=A0A110B640_9SPHI|nr:dephospho-CoA kinase [Mucilaginibacter gotjawali]MBB3057625.1 dephospho-CoA kinase [Mucilaginibacter gotjawali]BAU55288.1 Dephospho-CoA kinase [Mucilaginibacter gotjawali]